MLRPIALIAALTASLAAADSDLILHHGKIVTVDSRFSIAQAVAIKANKIVAVGAGREILAAERGPHPPPRPHRQPCARPRSRPQRVPRQAASPRFLRRRASLYQGPGAPHAPGPVDRGPAHLPHPPPRTAHAYP